MLITNIEATYVCGPLGKMLQYESPVIRQKRTSERRQRQEGNVLGE